MQRVRWIVHPYSMGNGAAIKSGARKAASKTILFMDADGQHATENIHRLLEEYRKGFNMVVGARTSNKSQAGIARGLGNKLYNLFASWMVGRKVEDLTSGFRVVDRDKFLQFLYMLPNGFSYPTTITMAFFRMGYTISYVPVKMPQRIGKSHLKVWRDGIKFLMIIFKVGTLYSPLKIFLPLAASHFLLGVGYYIYTFISYTRFTNMSALMLTSAVIIFLIGLLSEQITSLFYSSSSDSLN